MLKVIFFCFFILKIALIVNLKNIKYRGIEMSPDVLDHCQHVCQSLGVGVTVYTSRLLDLTVYSESTPTSLRVVPSMRLRYYPSSQPLLLILLVTLSFLLLQYIMVSSLCCFTTFFFSSLFNHKSRMISIF